MRKVFIIACTLLAACSSGSHAPETAVEPLKFSIRGTVTGLTGSGLTLRNNGGDELAVAASGPFGFSTPLSATSAFNVTVTGAGVANGRAAVDATGNVTVVWQLSLGQQEGQIWARRYSRSTGWQDAQRIDTIDNLSTDPQVTVDGAGNALVLWTDHEQGTRAFAAEHASGHGVGSSWSVPVSLQPEGSSNEGHARLAMNRNGGAIAVWGNAEGRIQASVYDATQWQAPVIISGIGVAWERSTQIDSGCCTGLFSRRHVVAGGWQETLGHGPFGLINGESLDIATHPDGDMVMIFQQRLVDDTIRIVRYQ